VPRAAGNRLALLRAMSRDPLATAARLRRDHGRIVLLPIPGLRVYLVSDPAAIQDALTLTNRLYGKGLPRRRDPTGPAIRPLERILGNGLLISDGEIWRHQRRLMAPLFHHASIEAYGATFASLAEQTGAGWRDGALRDLHRDMTELTLAIVARTVFDVDLDAEVVAHIRRSLTDNLSTARRRVVPWGRWADRLPLPSTRRWNADLAALDAMVYAMISRRRAAGAGGNDLLSLLLSVRDSETGETMADGQIRDEAVTVLLAGHETTASAVAWAFHLLGQHPTSQDRLGAELDEVLGGRLPGTADLPRLRYTAAVLHESLRLYPPAWILARRLLAPRQVCGYLLPAGSVVIFSPWLAHRDPSWWPDPEAFQPERWLSPAADGRPRYAYFPFGGGPRQCIGNTFAEMEAILALATLCRSWRVTPVPGSRVTPVALVTLRPRDGVPMTVHRRHADAGLRRGNRLL
jgi:cytochrome P450